MKYSNSHYCYHAINCLGITLLLALSSVFVAACERTLFNPEYEQSAYGLGLTVRANQAYYQYGSSVDFTLTIVNLTDRKLDLSTATSQLYDIMIIDQSDEIVWQYGRGGFFLMERSFELKSHQQKSFVVVCEDTLKAGQYTTIGWFMFLPTLRDTTGFIVLDGYSK